MEIISTSTYWGAQQVQSDSLLGSDYVTTYTPGTIASSWNKYYNAWSGSIGIDSPDHPIPPPKKGRFIDELRDEIKTWHGSLN